MRRQRSIFHWALVVSLLLHVVIVLLVLPGAHRLWSRSSEARPLFAMAPPQPEQKPLQFEFVDLAEEREEVPSREDAPLSDLDRRAHGGEGEASDRPGVRGTTPQLVQAEGAETFGRGAPPQRQAPEPQRVPPPEPPRERPEAEPREEPARRPQPEGAGEPERRPEPEPPAIQLPRTGAFRLPPSVGGLPEAPDRDGGQVDTSALSFDTQWYDWGPYARLMLAKIRRNWMIPELARLGVQGVVRIRFSIQRDGTVVGLRILDDSGKPPMDNAAFNAIARSSPFAPLPPDLTGVEEEGVTITFYYNMRPPDRG